MSTSPSQSQRFDRVDRRDLLRGWQHGAVRLAVAGIFLSMFAGTARGDGTFSSGGPYRLRARAGAAAEGGDASRYRLQASLGQTEAGEASSDGRWRLRGGFWPQPLPVAALPDRLFGNGFE